MDDPGHGLLSGTIAETSGAARPDRYLEKIADARGDAPRTTTSYAALPEEGLRHDVGVRGVKCRAVQDRQRIALARRFSRTPPSWSSLLNGTSAFDKQTEGKPDGIECTR